MKPVLVSTWGAPQKYFDAFLATSKRHGLTPQNADSETWPGQEWNEREWWRKSAAQARFCREHLSDYTHFAFCDAYDIVFAAGWDEILAKFEAFKSPIVFGAECYPWPDAVQAAEYPLTRDRCKFVNAGFWMGTAEAAMVLLEHIESKAKLKKQCDQGIMVDAYLSGKYPIALDTGCSLLFCCNKDSLAFLDLSGDRPRTKDSGQQPCLFHGNGNSDLLSVIRALK